MVDKQREIIQVEKDKQHNETIAWSGAKNKNKTNYPASETSNMKKNREMNQSLF